MIVIVDYGMGNLRSVEKAFSFLGYPVMVSGSPEALRQATGVVLPGVGAFGDAMRELGEREFIPTLRDMLESGVPFLGICLGYQLLFEESEESPGVAGLGVLPGRVIRFPQGVKVPHMGWNDLRYTRRHPLFAGVEEGSYFYFVHSYYVVPGRGEDAIAVTEYGVSFASGAGRDNLVGVQFHPEKSSSAGLRVLENFARWCAGEG